MTLTLTPARGPSPRPATAPGTRPAPTASDRDSTIDGVRTAALFVVVALHAMMVGVERDATGALTTSVALSGESWFTPITWLVQIMPLFFIAGGFASLSHWRRMQALGESATDYIVGRVRRLAVPAIIMIAVVGAVLLSAKALGAPAALIDEASLRIGQPLWFLAVYFGVTALVPVMAWLHTKRPALTIVGLALVAVSLDVVHSRLGIPVGYLNFIVVWPLMQQLGFVMLDTTATSWSRRRLLTGMLASVALLFVLLGCGWSPDMLVNLNPPTTAIMLLGSAQFCALLLVRSRLNTVMQHPILARTVSRMGSIAMGVYVWHMPVILAIVALSWAAGLPLPEPHSLEWWATRMPWLVLVFGCVIPFAARVAPVEKWMLATLNARIRNGAGRPSRPHPSASIRAAASVLLAVAGTAIALLAGIASAPSYLCAVALLAAAVALAAPGAPAVPAFPAPAASIAPFSLKGATGQSRY